MARNARFIAFIADQLAPLGHVTARPMFSGAGIYCDGTIFALVLRDTLYLKVDDANRADFAAAGSSPFTYEAKGRTVEINSYWRARAPLRRSGRYAHLGPHRPRRRPPCRGEGEAQAETELSRLSSRHLLPGSSSQ